MRLSILVVSRTANLLSRMLCSVKDALHLPTREVEILCSWNGSIEEETRIENGSGYKFSIAKRIPYHFGSNINELANLAKGDVFAFINDDVILDRNSLDSGLPCLLDDISTLCVGSLLRMPDGRLQHGGMSFDYHHLPYHIAEGLIKAKDVISGLPPFEVPCVTGALMLIRKSTFKEQPFDESYIRCGEDVQLNLDIREKLKGRVMLCPGMSGVHLESTTRAENNETGNTAEDIAKMKTRRRLFLDQASQEQLRVELLMSARERIFTKEVMEKERNHLHQQQAKAKDINYLENLEQDRDYLERDRDHWKDQTHSLQLARLKLEQKLKQTQRGA